MQNMTYAKALEVLRGKRPLVHHITNYVTVNDCANITLCIGASPVMSDAEGEVEQMVSLAGALVLNIGTLNDAQVRSMLLAGREANRRSIPIVLDPVGAGATKMRTEVTRMLLSELKVSVLKGNAGEIGVLAGSGGIVRGVDSEGVSGDPVSVAISLARSSGVTVAMSGATDVITDGQRTVLVDNGHPLMGRLSGTGCMVASVVGAFSAVMEDPVDAATSAFVCLGIAGEKAAERAKGPGSFKVALLDETYGLKGEDVIKMARTRTVQE
ncbi:MAG: hydroxyethylthiazole kinase [Methanomassiliicoccales archaeon]|nr:MAG: hydroxyethylthiazole kinase [Methanomassiliicoccales archaeon]